IAPLPCLSSQVWRGQGMAEQARLLVVDDDAEVRQLLCDYLGGQGFRVEGCGDSQALRQTLTREAPDLVLLDVGLPGEDGLSLARYLREHRDLPVIIISGAGTPLDRIIGLEVGADDYLAKPFELRELLRQVWLELRGKPYTPLAFKTPGAYRLVRHPLYVGWFFAFWCTPNMSVTHMLFALVSTAYILAAISFEERDLLQAHP